MEIQIKNICCLIRFIQPFLRYFENDDHSRYEGIPLYYIILERRKQATVKDSFHGIDDILSGHALFSKTRTEYVRSMLLNYNDTVMIRRH